jgi:predicted regulator of Ras-like GTPase activity (Roadblock/LC7/MglB family)
VAAFSCPAGNSFFRVVWIGSTAVKDAIFVNRQDKGRRQLSYTLGQKQLDRIEEILQQDLIDNGVRCVFLIDMAGNIITNLDNGEKKHDIYSLAALAAGNFGAVSAMAKIIGENEFSLLFHKGKKENIHFNKIATEFLLITIFGNDISLGFLRLKVGESVEELKVILEPLLIQ